MLPTEQQQFFDLVGEFLADYVKQPTPFELESWWAACRGFSLHDVERALRAHQQDEKANLHAPKPIDVKKRLATTTSDASRCSATDPTGRCEYPGIFSDGTQGEGRWYCPWHRLDREGPEASAWIQRSREIPYEIAKAKRVERMSAEARRSAAVVATAHAIALKHGNRQWQTGIKLPFNGELSREEERIVNQGNYEGRAAE